MEVDSTTTAEPRPIEEHATELVDGEGSTSSAPAQAENGDGVVDAEEDVTAATAASAKGAGRGGKAGGRGGRGGGAKAAGRGGGKAAAGAAKGSGKAVKESGAAGGGAGANPTFPLARVSRIVKADRDIETTSKDAIWIIAVATELFIKHLTDSAIAKARLEKKKVVTYKELASAVETQPEFFFLSDIVPQSMPLEKAFGIRQELEEENRARAVGLIIDEESEEEVEDEEEEGEEGEAEAEAEEKGEGEAEREGGQPTEPAGNGVAEESAPVAPAKKTGATTNGKAKGKKAGKGQQDGADISTASATKKTSTNSKKSRTATAEQAVDEEMADP